MGAIMLGMIKVDVRGLFVGCLACAIEEDKNRGFCDEGLRS